MHHPVNFCQSNLNYSYDNRIISLENLHYLHLNQISLVFEDALRSILNPIQYSTDISVSIDYEIYNLSSYEKRLMCFSKLIETHSKVLNFFIRSENKILFKVLKEDPNFKDFFEIACNFILNTSQNRRKILFDESVLSELEALHLNKNVKKTSLSREEKTKDIQRIVQEVFQDCYGSKKPGFLETPQFFVGVKRNLELFNLAVAADPLVLNSFLPSGKTVFQELLTNECKKDYLMVILETLTAIPSDKQVSIFLNRNLPHFETLVENSDFHSITKKTLMEIYQKCLHERERVVRANRLHLPRQSQTAITPPIHAPLKPQVQNRLEALARRLPPIPYYPEVNFQYQGLIPNKVLSFNVPAAPPPVINNVPAAPLPVLPPATSNVPSQKDVEVSKELEEILEIKRPRYIDDTFVERTQNTHKNETIKQLLETLKKDVTIELKEIMEKKEGIDPEVYKKLKKEKLTEIYRRIINANTNVNTPIQYERMSQKAFFSPFPKPVKSNTKRYMQILDQKADKLMDKLFKRSGVKLRPSHEGGRLKRGRGELGERRTTVFEKRPAGYIPRDEPEESREIRQITDENIATISFGAEAPPRPDHIYRLEEKIREKFEKYLKGQKFARSKLKKIKNELVEEFKKHPEKMELGWKIEILGRKIDAKKRYKKKPKLL